MMRGMRQLAASQNAAAPGPAASATASVTCLAVAALHRATHRPGEERHTCPSGAATCIRRWCESLCHSAAPCFDGARTPVTCGAVRLHLLSHQQDIGWLIVMRHQRQSSWATFMRCSNMRVPCFE